MELNRNDATHGLPVVLKGRTVDAVGLNRTFLEYFGVYRVQNPTIKVVLCDQIRGLVPDEVGRLEGQCGGVAIDRCQPVVERFARREVVEDPYKTWPFSMCARVNLSKLMNTRLAVRVLVASDLDEMKFLCGSERRLEFKADEQLAFLLG